MDTFSALMSGFAVALTLKNLMWGFLGVTLGTAVGVLPGVGPALTIALLLPATANLDPTGALIMFAGIYYGAMFGGSTTSILLNTPGESATIVTAMEGNLMAKRGRAGPALATAAIGSFVAGTIATILLTVMAPIVVEFALKFGPAEYFAVMVLAFTTVSAVLGASKARGLASLFFGLTIGLIGLDSQTGQARFTLGIPELLDGIDVVVVAVGLFAVGETLYIATYLNRQGDVIETDEGLDLDEQGGLEALVEAVAARYRLRIPVRHDPRRRRRDPDVPFLRDREEALEASGGIRQGRDRGRGRTRGGEQCVGHRNAGAAAHARAADDGDRRDHPRRLPAMGAAAGPAAVRDAAAADLGPHRQHVRRQRDPADPQPPAGRHLGQAAARFRGRCSTPAS